MRGWAALVGSVVLATAATAQFEGRRQSGSMLPVRPDKVEEERAGAIRKAFGGCIYRHDRRLAQRYLRNSDGYAVSYTGAGLTASTFNSRFGMEDCLGREASTGELGLRMSQPVIRAMLAEEAYLDANRVAPAPLAADAAVPERTFASTGEKLPPAKALAGLADCVVRKEPARADALLRSTPGSPVEMTAARALGPTIGGCLYQGQTLSLSVPSIRAFVADGAWWLFARDGAVGGGR